MKTIINKLQLVLFVGLATLLVVSCKKNSTKKMEKNITDGTWKVTLFSEDGSNETSYFSSYSFTFSDDGTASATNGASTVTGSWSTSDDNSNDDSPSDLHFNLTFPDVSNFDELSDDWHVISQSDNTIELNDVSGGNGGTDLLTFTKN